MDRIGFGNPSWMFHRRTGRAADLIRMDRALLYIKQEITGHIATIDSKTTKTIGDYYYRLSSFARESAQILSMGGDRVLADTIFSNIRGLSIRSPREMAISRLRKLLSLIDSYEIVEVNEEMEALSPSVSSLADEGQETIDVSEQHVVFVIMPFNVAFNDVWKGAIEKAALELRMRPVRVDMINKSTNITDDIVESIKKCHIAIVDVSDNNPNVMFELGYTLALSKPSVIISQSAEFLPFDIRNIRTIVYENSWSGVEVLRGKLKDFLRGSAPQGVADSKRKQRGKVQQSHTRRLPAPKT